jgi:hypothetical protein
MKSLSHIEVVGVALHGAEIDTIYSGQMEQLQKALTRQNLELGDSRGRYTLELRTASAVNAP